MSTSLGKMFILASYGAHRLLPRRSALAIWQIGLAAAITILVLGSKESAFALFYTLLPIAAAASGNWQLCAISIVGHGST
jgi:hypothetical protein